jgi:hypothetical protein
MKRYTCKRQHFITDVDGCIVLPFVEGVLSPIPQVFVHDSTFGLRAEIEMDSMIL